MHPFNFTSEKVCKISDFVSAAINEAREEERKKQKEETTVPSKKKPKTAKQDEQEEEQKDDNDFMVIEDARARTNLTRKGGNQGQWNQQNKY